MTGLGTVLQETREQQGLTIEDMAERTKIRPQFLQAMEEGNFQLLPGEAYVRPFLRTYARALGLGDEQVILELDARESMANAGMGPAQERRAQLRSQRKRRFLVRMGLTLVILAGLGYTLYRLIFS